MIFLVSTVIDDQRRPIERSVIRAGLMNELILWCMMHMVLFFQVMAKFIVISSAFFFRVLIMSPNVSREKNPVVLAMRDMEFVT